MEGKSSQKPMSILYVEDEPETRELIADTLRDDFPEMHLHVAGGGAEGLALFREHRPQVVVTDIRMPDIDGLAMAAEIRAIDSEVPLVALTAYSDTSFLVRAIELGFAQYVFKPVDLDKLMNAVGKAVEVAQLRGQAEAQNERLRESERRLQATFDQAAIGIAHLALDGTIVRVNERFCEIVGCSRDARAVTLFDSTHPDDVAMCHHHHQLLVDGDHGSYSLEKRYVHHDGSVVWAALTITLIHDPHNGQSFMVAIIDDITARKSLEEEIGELNAALAARATELEMANTDLKAFNYTVAHDLRKPLTVINWHCQSIREFCGEKLDDACMESLDEAYDGTLRMNRLIDVLLLFAEAAHAELKVESVDLTALAQDVAAELQKGEPQRRVLFEIQRGMKVEGDTHLLRVLLANLLGNGWKYTSEREGAAIAFGRREESGRATYFVRDNGIGFDMAQANDIFVPFRRLHREGRIGGLGIGLATVQRIVKRHGGRIWAEGEVGKGATFYFTLR